jgi:hypothetical protein
MMLERRDEDLVVRFEARPDEAACRQVDALCRAAHENDLALAGRMMN